MARNAELEAAIHASPDDDGSHETDMLGPLADYKDMLSEVEWRNGFIRSVKLASPQ